MFARITRVHVKPGRLDDFIAYRNSREPILKTLQGLRQIIGLSGKDGEYFVIALYESETHAETSLKDAGKFWFKISDLIEGSTDVRTYDVTHFQTFFST